jgi:DNA adenine methylase
MPQLEAVLTDVHCRRIIEPFAGGAAFFHHFDVGAAIINDVNSELISAYEAIRDSPDEVEEQLSKFSVNRETYMELRVSLGGSKVRRAARFFFLNRTSFSGIYRVNKKGQFNVPFGGGKRTPACLLGTGRFQEVSRLLAGVELRVGDFADVLREAGDGDVVYCDPTYTVRHDRNGFRRYNEVLFSWDDQERLAALAAMAARRGAAVLVSNAAHKDVLELYPEFNKIFVSRSSSLASSAARRGTATEVVLMMSPTEPASFGS